MFAEDDVVNIVYKFQSEIGRRLSLIGNCSVSEVHTLAKFLARLVILEQNEYLYYQNHLDVFILGIQKEIPGYIIKNYEFTESLNTPELYGWPHDIIYFNRTIPIGKDNLIKLFSLNKGRDFLIINGVIDQMPKDLIKKQGQKIIVEKHYLLDSKQIIRVKNH
jgi:hypothetical protein